MKTLNFILFTLLFSFHQVHSQCSMNLIPINTSCSVNTGEIHGEIFNGTPPFQIEVDGMAPFTENANSFSIFGLEEGIYSVSATDANGCIATASATVTGAVAPSIEANVVSSCGWEACIDLIINGGTAPFQAFWNGQVFNLPMDCVSFPGNVIDLEVIDNNGCTAITTVVVPQLFDISIIVLENDCENATFEATYSSSDIVEPVTYLWDNGVITSTREVTSYGVYSVTLTDAGNCTAETTIAHRPLVINSLFNDDVECAGENNGRIFIMPFGGFGPYTYTWIAPLPNVNLNSNLSAGTYEITVTDSWGCTVTSGPVIINEPAPIEIVVTTTDVICFGEATGSAEATASGGTGTFTYNWDTATGSSTAPIATGLVAGAYSVTVTDANGCTATSVAVVDQPSDFLVVEITGSSESCLGDAMATATAFGGLGAYNYFWSNMETTPTITNLVAGIYSVTVTDESGCTNENSINIASPISLEVSSTLTDCDTADGTATVVVTGGATSPSYLWSNGQTEATAIDLAAGGYSVTVTDGATNCQVHRNIIVERDPACFVVINGYVIVDDEDQDCMEDMSSLAAANIRVELSDGQIAYTDSEGYYEFKADAGTYDISISYSTNIYEDLCNDVISVAATDWGSIYEEHNFYLQFGDEIDIELKVVKPRARPGFIQKVRICVMNRGAIPMSGTLTFVHPEIQEYLSTNFMETSYDAATQTLTYDYEDIAPGTIKVYKVELKTPVGTTLGTGLNYFFSAPVAGDLTPANNEITCSEEVTGSFDPNDKAVVPAGIGPEGIISMEDSTLSYRIRFQNTGTDTAFTVILRDTLDANLDVRTLTPGAASHDYVARIIRDNILEIVFDNILLPDSFVNEPASNGFFIFDINVKSESPYGTFIENSAGIYFDFNEPVITNTVVNSIQMIVATPEIQVSNLPVQIFPNPIQQESILEYELSESENVSINIYDLHGRRVKVLESGMLQVAGVYQYKINSAALESGVYLVKVETADDSGVVRMVKM